jgi:kelch-like protein 10
MSCHRSYVSVAVVGELIYAIGGWNGYCRLKTAERYNCKMNMWSNIAPMNEERRDASATALNGKVYIDIHLTMLFSYLDYGVECNNDR